MKPWIKGGISALFIHAIALVYFYAMSWCGFASASGENCARYMRTYEVLSVGADTIKDYRLAGLVLILGFLISFTVGALAVTAYRAVRKKA